MKTFFLNIRKPLKDIITQPISVIISNINNGIILWQCCKVINSNCIEYSPYKQVQNLPLQACYQHRSHS